MSEPKTIREVNASFSIFQRMVWTIIGFMGAFVVGAGALYVQLGDLKTDVAVIRANSTAAVERLTSLDARVEKRLGDVDQRLQGLDQRLQVIDRNVQEFRGDDRVLRAISRVESLSQTSKLDLPVAGLYVTNLEAGAIVQYLRPPIRSDKPTTLTVGSRVEEGDLRPLPGDLVLKAPRLKDMKYVLDGNAIALVGPGTDIVFAIL